MMRSCPKDCPERSPTCHSECERHREYREQKKMAAEAKQKDWVVDNECYNFQRDSIMKYKRRSGRR